MWGPGCPTCKASCGTSGPRAVVDGHHNTVNAGAYGLAGPHNTGTEFIRQVLLESQKVWLAHARAPDGLIKARPGPGGTMAWAL